MNPLWLARMAQWARNPPSPARVKLVLGVVAVCFLLFGYEYFFGWPEALTLDRGGQAHRTLRP